MNLILIGAPGSGKGTQSKFIVENFGYHQFSTGDALREAIKNNTPLGLKVNSYIKKGSLVPDEVIFSIVNEKLDFLKLQKGIIYDGFPRNIDQAKKLDEILSDRSQKVNLVIYLKIADDLLTKRIVGRRINPKIGKEYHIQYNPPKIFGKCDVDGSDLIQRVDDAEEKVKIRIDVFKQVTIPLLEYYKNCCVEIDASHSINFVSSKIHKLLH